MCSDNQVVVMLIYGAASWRDSDISEIVQKAYFLITYMRQALNFSDTGNEKSIR